MAGGTGFEPATPSLGGSLPNQYTINYAAIKEDFTIWLRSQGLNPSYRKHMIRDLDRFVTVITNPMDVVKIFSELSDGQKHNLNRALRALFNFLEAQGFSTTILDTLRSNIPKDHVGIDVKVPTENQIIASLRVINKAAATYNALYNLILDNGLRISEAVKFINEFKSAKPERLNGFYVAPLGYFRTSKVAYYAFFTEKTMQLLKTSGSVTNVNARSYLRARRHRRNLVSCKYLRKFAFDKMIELEIPESVADFIQGRTPKSIGAKHYMVLLRQAKKFYPRYAEYITRLRQKALN